MPWIMCDNDKMMREVEGILVNWTLPEVIDHALRAYRMIERTWVQDTHLLCPWWVWREFDDGMLRFNLIGLVAYSFGWTVTPETYTQHVVISEESKRNLRGIDIPRSGGKEAVDELAWKLGINRESPISQFIGAVDAVRRGDYQLAGSLYYKRSRRPIHMGQTTGRKIYRLGDESARSPSLLVKRLRQDLPRLGPVDMRHLGSV